MKSYTKENIPKNKYSNAYKIWKVLENDITELHYNANNYGNNKYAGWGTWACIYDNELMFCGIKNNDIYLQQMSAPFSIMVMGSSN